LDHDVDHEVLSHGPNKDLLRTGRHLMAKIFGHLLPSFWNKQKLLKCYINIYIYKIKKRKKYLDLTQLISTHDLFYRLLGCCLENRSSGKGPGMDGEMNDQ
jgi:hypothetical protein